MLICIESTFNHVVLLRFQFTLITYYTKFLFLPMFSYLHISIWIGATPHLNLENALQYLYSIIFVIHASTS